VRIHGEHAVQLHQVRLISFQEFAQFFDVMIHVLLKRFVGFDVLIADGKFHGMHL
jgi:hypothetical protein